MLKRVLFGALGLALLVTGLAFAFQAQLARALYERRVDRQMSLDRMAELPDGLHLAFCGTGSPLPDPSRAPSCAVVIAGDRLFVVDSGAGSVGNLLLMGIPAGQIEAVLLTHFHSDHIGGLGDLALQRWIGEGRNEPLPVYGAAGVETVVAGFNQAYAIDATYRTGHHGEVIAPPSGFGMEAQPFAIAGFDQTAPVKLLENNGLTIWAVAVDHAPASPAVAYRFDYQGRSLVMSGDLVADASPGFQALAAGTDLLVVEALQPDLLDIINAGARARGNERLDTIMIDIRDYHTTPEQAASVARSAQARALVLNHIVPALPSRSLNAAFLGDAAAAYSGPIRIAEDGLVVSLPTGDDGVSFQSWR
ncbi:MBL fold metallo-hydrolase [Maricaulis salignorans]|uniref:Ribonuclease Z n=1 Tax=Maricaulis salignorans TaxID=144026 RepID=A0A1G9M1W9_9PROT|nr:MBL fold metallo-hydrolase [Maricaulis salignorans]SDL68259.1 ribonuclease Z [Maricaulis salignorans]